MIQVPAGPPAATVQVMIPAYGDGPLLRAAVRSVLGQDDPGWLLTLVDDGPPAPELEGWLASLADPRVQYLRNPDRLGITGNFQRCVDLASAPMVVLMGADDLMLPPYVRIVTAAAAHQRAPTMVMPAVRVVDAAGHQVRPAGDRVKAALAPTVRTSRLLAAEDLAASLLRGNWMYFPAVAFRREPLQAHGFRPGYQIVQDLDLYLRLLLDGATLVLLEQVAFEYRRHAHSLSSTESVSGRRFAEERALFAEAAQQMRERGWKRAERAANLHLTSRMHALMDVPAALFARDTARALDLARHATARTGR
jgi:GT2 family glycosyltransferase